MNRVIMLLTVLLLVMLMDRSALANRPVYYDLVKITLYNRVNNLVLDGSSYPSRRESRPLNLPKMCILEFIEDCNKPLANITSCSVVYYNEDICNVSLFELVHTVQKRDGKAVIYRTLKIDQYLRELYDNRVTFPVILTKEIEIYGFKDEAVRYVNITVETETQLSNERSKGFGNERSTTTFYFVVFAFTILLLLSLTWFIFNYLRRCHHMYTAKRRRVRICIVCNPLIF